MNYTYLIRRSAGSESSLRLLSSYLYRYVHNASTAKADTYTNTKNKEINPSSHKKSSTVNRSEESDCFGTLQKPLENAYKYKRARSSAVSVNQENKRIIRVKKPQIDESNVFGNLSENNAVWYPDLDKDSKVDNDLSDDSVLVKSFSKKHRCPEKYLEEMKRLVKEKKVKEALDLFVDMKRNFVKPLHPHYTFMIGVCGKIGYTEMAFKLLRQMTDRAYTPTPATLTGMFNSCAESPFREYGLKKAHLLRDKIKEKNWLLTQITYHAMIKAFGRGGDLVTAFKIVDEMAEADIKIDVSTYSFLLQSCISNKEAGFTYAIEVWRKMKAKRCKPNTFTCNLLLRATRDCDVGPEDISCLLLQHWSSFSKRPYGFLTHEELKERPVLKLKSATDEAVPNTFESKYNIENKQSITGNSEKADKSFDPEKIPSYELQSIENTSMIKNSVTSSKSLLLSRPIDGPEILELVNIKTPSDRFSLLGGLEGFFKFLDKEKIQPNIKTFTLLIDCVPDNTEAEDKLIAILESYQQKPNIEFCNALIKKRHFRKENSSAQQVLLLMNKYSLIPDIMTFGALVLGCRTLPLAHRFIDDMKKFGTHPNIEIVGSMVRQACMILDFPYMKYALKLMEEEQIKPNEKILSTLEKTLSNVKKNIILMEQGKEFDKFFEKKNLQEDYKDFFHFYEKWLKRMKFESEEGQHPWLQYKTEIIDRSPIEDIVH